MKKSKNPNKWYFDVLECNESGDLRLTLSDRPGEVDDDLTYGDLHDNIQHALVSVNMHKALIPEDSTCPWRLPTDMRRGEIIQIMKENGFNYHKVYYSELFLTPMKWSMKTEMLIHFNKNNQSKVVDLVVNNLKEMDEEAWSIFFNHVRTSDDDLLPQKKEHKRIYRACKKLVFTDRNVNFKKTFYIRVFENEILKFW